MIHPKMNELLSILDQEHAHGYSEGYAAAMCRPREWVDLTNAEIGEIYRAGWANNMDFAEAIQAKLKEKNTPTV